MIQSRPNEVRADESTSGMPGDESKNRLKQHGDDAKRQAEELSQKAGEKAREAGDSLKRAGRDAAQRASEAARQTGDQVRERASAMMADRKSRLADEVGVFGQALHRAADTLDENDDAALGSYAHQAGDMIDSCARYLRDADPSEVIRGVSNFTRRHPELVLGGLFLAGVSLARFLKASDRRQDRYDFERDDDFELGYNLDQDMIGYETEDSSAYGDVARYAGEVPSNDPYATTPTFGTEGVSYTRNEDIPATTSPQPGSYPPSTTSGDLSPRLTDETDALGSDVGSKPGPNCPR
jgi:vacuolar-type H+-ATPase subunit H